MNGLELFGYVLLYFCLIAALESTTRHWKRSREAGKGLRKWLKLSRKEIVEKEERKEDVYK